MPPWERENTSPLLWKGVWEQNASMGEGRYKSSPMEGGMGAECLHKFERVQGRKRRYTI
jgi:hypothetical protein